MADGYAVIICSPDHAGAVAAALMGRAAKGGIEVVCFDSQGLAGFFDSAVQTGLPRSYDLIICGPELVRLDWDGRLVRPQLVDGLRGFLGTVRWLSVGDWAPEDRRAVAHLIGAKNLVTAPDGGALAAKLREEYLGSDDPYEDSLVRFASGQLTADEESAWGAGLRQVITVLKADRCRLAEVVRMLADGGRQEVIDMYAQMAAETEGDNQRFADKAAESPMPMGEGKLVFVSLPRERQPFWAEIGAQARESARADFSLCRLEGRSVMVLARGAGHRADLRVWARYVTDMLPGAQCVGAEPDAVPIVFERPADDGLKQDVLTMLHSGAHLLKEPPPPTLASERLKGEK